jgi:hypothetical protein
MAHTNKDKFQPVLLTWLWLYYIKGREVNVPTVFRELVWVKENGYWCSKKHQDWVDAARQFSNEVYEASRTNEEQEAVESS